MSTPLEIALEEYREAHKESKADSAEFDRLNAAAEVMRDKMTHSYRRFREAEHKLHEVVVSQPQESDSVKPPEPVYNIPG